MLTLEPKLLSLREYSLSYKNLNVENTVSREHLIDEIEELASNDFKLIIVEGSEGIGKTNLLLQFAEKHQFDCFSYFINPACRFTYNQDYLMEDLGKQMLFHNKPELIEDDIAINEGVFGNLCFDLLRTPGKKNKRLYFVLDGLDQIEKSDIEILNSVLGTLPWATNNFCFIVSGETERLKHILPIAAFKQSKPIRVTKFNFDETCNFFQWFDEAGKINAREVYSIWKGHPERLAQVRRILKSGVEIQDFLMRDDIKEKNELFEIEWKESQIGQLDFSDDIIKLICILAFDDNIRNLDKLSRIIYSEADLNTRAGELSFLVISNDEVSFVSNAFRLFVRGKLKKFEKNTSSMLIGYFTDQNDLSSVLNLPTLFEKNQQWNEIINVLTVDNLGLIISNSHSFADIKKQINYGYKASKQLKKAYENTFRFSLYRSTINGLQKSDTRENQIKAYIALGKQEEAFALISNAVLKEDRLKMLVKYAMESKVRSLSVETVIIDEIKELIGTTDIGYLRENFAELTIGLAYFLPEQAVFIIEKAAGLAEKSSSLEWLLSYISSIISKHHDLTALSTENSDSRGSFIDNFTKSIGLGINNVEPENIIEELSKNDSSSDRLFLLRKWIDKNQKASNILQVIEYGINLLLQESYNIKPTTTTLLEIVKPILYLSDHKEVLSMATRIEELMSSINNPTLDRIKLSILLIQCYAKFDIDKANDRSIELESFINNAPDVSLKVEALADCWMLIKNIEKNNVDLDLFILDETFIKEKLLLNIDILLLSTASHYDELIGCIEIITKIDIKSAILISSKANTAERRSSLILRILETYVELPVSQWDELVLKETIALLSSDRDHTYAIHVIINSALEQKNETKNYLQKIVFLMPNIEGALGNIVKAGLICKTILLLNLEPTEFIGLRPNYKNLIAKLKTFLLKYWNKIDDPIGKVRIAYTMSSDLADNEPELATEYFYKAEELLHDSIIDNNIHEMSLIESIRLMIRLFAGLIQKDKTYSYDKISELIKLLPSTIDKVKLWSELAVRASLAGAREIAQELVNSKILPEINTYKSSKDNFYLYQVLDQSASAIQLTQPETLKLYLDAIPDAERDNLLHKVCFVLLNKEPYGEPFDETKGSPKFNYQDAIEYITLLSFIENDHAVYTHISNLCSVPKRFSNSFIREQKIEIRKRLLNLIDQKLPNQRTGVKHEGYLIASLACVEQFNVNQNVGEQTKIFDDLAARAEKISNLSDRSFVFSILASECNVKKRRVELIIKAFDEADQITVVHEKIARYRIALDFSYKIAAEVFHEKIKKIHAEILNLDDDDLFPSFRKLIDLAYKYDKNVAQKFVSTIDTDPARKQLAEPASDRFSQLEAEKDVCNDYSQLSRIKDRMEIGHIVSKLQGELNSGKRVSRDIDQIYPILHTASRLPFFYALPIFQFFIQNVVKNNDSSDKLLLSFYDVSYSNAKLCYNLICSVTNKNINALTYSNIDNDSTLLVRPGMRKNALEFIEKNLKNSSSKEIYIIDPYFSQKDVLILKDIMDWCYGVTLYVLTSIESTKEFSKYTFYNAWTEISAEEPPTTHFVSAGNLEKKSPFHDRYIIMYDVKQGLRLGTSLNSLGDRKISEISTMLATEVDSVYETIIVPLIKQRLSSFNQGSVKYETFDF